MCKHIPNIYSDYGDGRNEYSCTFRANETDGMDTPRIMKYVDNIRHVLPDRADISGKCIMLKDDLGPGRYNNKLLDWFHES